MEWRESMLRRQFLRLALGAGVCTSIPKTSSARSYPTRPVRVLVGSAVGGVTDILARRIGQWLSERLEQPFIIENKPGGGSNVATEAAVHAAPDGYTILLLSPAQYVNATLYENLSYDFLHDLIPVAGISRERYLMVVNPTLGISNVAEFIAYAKSHQRLNFASPGIGTGTHISAELFNMMTGLDMVHVPYRSGAPALVDLIAGQVHVMFPAIPSSIQLVRSNQLRAIGITSSDRSPTFPEVPPIGHTVQSYESTTVFGLAVPAKTPLEIVGIINTAVNDGLANAPLASAFENAGSTPLPLSPEQYMKLLESETAKWNAVIKFAGIRAK